MRTLGGGQSFLNKLPQDNTFVLATVITIGTITYKLLHFITNQFHNVVDNLHVFKN